MKKSLKTKLLLAAAVVLMITAAVFLIGPRCSYKEKISDYRTEQCKNHTGIRRPIYCKEHMYLKELPKEMYNAISNWDYELMKNVLVQAEEKELDVKDDWNVWKLVKEIGAVECRYPDCKLYIPGDGSEFCPDHEFVNEQLNELKTAIINFDEMEIARLYNESKNNGFRIFKTDDSVQEAFSAMIDAALVAYPRSGAVEMLNRLWKLDTLFGGSGLALDAYTLDKLQFFVKLQAMDLTQMDPEQGYYAGRKNTSTSTNDGLLATSASRKYGYNYEIFSRSNRAAALNNGPTIESSSALYYKDIKVAEGLGRGIWAIETPEYDYVVAGDSVYIIDNNKNEIALEVYEKYSSETIVTPEKQLLTQDGAETYFMRVSYLAGNMLVKLNDDDTIAVLALDAAHDAFGEGVTSEEFASRFIGKKGPFGVPEEPYDAKAVVKALNTLYPETAPAVEAVDAFAEEETAVAVGESYSVTRKGFLYDVTVDVTVADGVITAIQVDASKETGGFGERCGKDQAFLNQFVGKTIPVEGVDVIAGVTTTSQAVIDAINSIQQ